jgi:phosphate starvation-inducible protein PhoH
MRGEKVTCTTKVQLFVEECPSCAILFGVPEDHHSRIVKSGGAQALYCPNGHAITWRKSEADQLREQLDKERRQRQRAEQAVAREADYRREAEERAKHERNRANGYKGHATRITKRAKAGVCPCCNRTFVKLAQHMATKHPQFTPMPPEIGEPLGSA